MPETENRVDHNRQQKAAVINDFTSFGRCSLAVTIPILSAMKVQCCSVPTAIFTNHTGFRNFSWTDYTAKMDDYIRDWKATGLRFDAIMTGFLGSKAQVEFVHRFLDAFRDEKTIVCVDPVMGDYGRLYATYDRELAESMRGFLSVADILTPNLTEACVLAGRDYASDLSDDELFALCRSLGVKKIVVTGIVRGDELVNFVYEEGREPVKVTEPKIGPDRSGTGDVFSAVVLAEAIRGENFVDSVAKAARYITATVRRTTEMALPVTDGLAIEETLSLLMETAKGGRT